MKNLFFLLLLFTLSCESEKNKEYNFDMTRTISLRLAHWKPEQTRRDTIHYPFDRKTFDELLSEENEFTYSRWYQSADTIWFYKTILDGRGHLISQYYVIYSDSTFVEMKNHGVPYVCPKYLIYEHTREYHLKTERVD
jgi:hypothetical protein